MERESFVFYMSFYEALKDLPDDTYIRLSKAICEYALHGILPILEGFEKALFIAIKPQIDANNKRYESGKKGGRPRKNNELEVQQNEQEAQQADNTEIKNKETRRCDTNKKPVTVTLPSGIYSKYQNSYASNEPIINGELAAMFMQDLTKNMRAKTLHLADSG